MYPLFKAEPCSTLCLLSHLAKSFLCLQVFFYLISCIPITKLFPHSLTDLKNKNKNKKQNLLIRKVFYLFHFLMETSFMEPSVLFQSDQLLSRQLDHHGICLGPHLLNSLFPGSHIALFLWLSPHARKPLPSYNRIHWKEIVFRLCISEDVSILL